MSLATFESAPIPGGVEIVTMPRLSDTMEEGTVAPWLKKVGDKVEEGDILAEIETDKATMEFESFNEGTLLYVGIQEGQSAPVDSVLAIIGPEGTDVSGIAENFQAGGSTEAKEEEKPAVSRTGTAVAPSAEAAAVTNDGGRIFASPLARKIAEG